MYRSRPCIFLRATIVPALKKNRRRKNSLVSAAGLP